MCEDRKCINCKYVYTSYSEEPCKSCDRHCRSNWTEALTRGTTLNTTVPTKEFEVGDLVTIGYSKDVYVYLCDNLFIRVPADVTIDYMTWSSTHRHSITAGIDILKANTNDFIKFASPVAMDRVECATVTEIMDHNATARKDKYLSI